MPERLFQALRTHGGMLRRRWERRLRAVPPTSALAAPDTLVHLMDSTLERFFQTLADQGGKSPRPAACPPCPCGMNPLLSFFMTAEKALMETLFLDEDAWPVLTVRQREDALRIMRNVLQRIAHEEIQTFCAVCRSKAPIVLPAVAVTSRARPPRSERAGQPP